MTDVKIIDIKPKQSYKTYDDAVLAAQKEFADREVIGGVRIIIVATPEEDFFPLIINALPLEDCIEVALNTLS